MMIKPTLTAQRAGSLFCALGILFASYTTYANEPSPEASTEEVVFSEAETLLWMTDQLHNIDGPVVLNYDFKKSGTFEQGFDDTVTFSVDQVHSDGMKSAKIVFFTGERNFKVPDAERTNVNPVLKVYLQGDVYEMNRLTDESGESRERWRYFQRRIKFALSEASIVEPTSITFAGNDYAAKKVTFRPYVNDPKRNLFEQFADKEYEVIVADELPGYLYRIETIIPAAADGEKPLIQEVLQLVSVEAQEAQP